MKEDRDMSELEMIPGQSEISKMDGEASAVMAAAITSGELSSFCGTSAFEQS